MALPDIHAWIKISDPNGKTLAHGASWQSTQPATFRVTYYVANEGDESAKFYVVGALSKNGTKVPNPVPAQLIQLAENTLWKKSYDLSWSPSDGQCKFLARIIGDVGDFVDEDDESNNAFSTSFSVFDPPK